MKVLMVCLGNICRSPLAEGILREKTKQLDILIDSAGTSNYHINKPPDIRSIEIADKHNINIRNLKARQFKLSDFKKFDVIYAMDIQNLNHLKQLAKNKKESSKIKLILEEIYPNTNQSVPDPYYGGRQGFQNTYNMLNQACEKIIQNIE